MDLKKINSIKDGHLLLNVVANLMDLLIIKLDKFYSINEEHMVYSVISSNFSDNQKALYNELKKINEVIDC